MGEAAGGMGGDDNNYGNLNGEAEGQKRNRRGGSPRR